MGFTEQDILRALSEAAEESPGKELTSLWPTVLCILRRGEVYGSSSLPTTTKIDQHPAPSSCQGREGSYFLPPSYIFLTVCIFLVPYKKNKKMLLLSYQGSCHLISQCMLTLNWFFMAC